MRNLELIFGLAGQTLYFDPPEGRPSGMPTVRVLSTETDDDGTAESATTGACSVDAVNTTLNGAVVEGAKSLVVTSGTGVTKGRRYLVTDTDGDSELVEVIAVTGPTVHVTRPLLNDYATGSMFVGTRISIAVDTTWASRTDKITDVLGYVWRTTADTPDEHPPAASGYRARWSYTVVDATISVSYLDLVRYRAKSLVSPLDVDRRIPGWIDRLPIDYRRDQGAGLIAEAFHTLKMDALADAKLLRRIRDTQVISELVMYRANLLAVHASVLAGGGSAQMIKVAEDLFTQRYEQLLREPKVPVDNTGGGSNGQGTKLPIWRL